MQILIIAKVQKSCIAADSQWCSLCVTLRIFLATYLVSPVSFEQTKLQNLHQIFADLALLLRYVLADVAK